MSKDDAKNTPTMQVWTREGFAGQVAVQNRSFYSPDYLAVKGPHAPRRSVLSMLKPDDSSNEKALPTVIATSRVGIRLLTSARRKPMNFTVRKVEADELHFIQSGQVKFDTDVGTIVANEGDFVCIPRSIAYRFYPTEGEMRSLILESPAPLSLTPPAPIGMINFDRDMEYARVDPDIRPDGPGELLLKSHDDEITTFQMACDPLALNAHPTQQTPVWKLNLNNIQVHAYEPHGGPPSAFMSSEDNKTMLFNLSARSGARPPVHVNADFDEVILYVRGPGAWGACNEPGTLTWVPKGVVHHGPDENVAEGYTALLIETRATFRFTPEALAASDLMETGNYGVHQGNRTEQSAGGAY